MYTNEWNHDGTEFDKKETAERQGMIESGNFLQLHGTGTVQRDMLMTTNWQRDRLERVELRIRKAKRCQKQKHLL